MEVLYSGNIGGHEKELCETMYLVSCRVMPLDEALCCAEFIGFDKVQVRLRKQPKLRERDATISGTKPVHLRPTRMCRAASESK